MLFCVLLEDGRPLVGFMEWECHSLHVLNSLEMIHSSLIFCNVDTQNDFVEPWGKLYVPGAEQLKPLWKTITQAARKNHISVLNTADYHFINSAEIDEHPDMVKTFPPHCLATTRGAEYVEETRPYEPLIFRWDTPYPRMALELELKDAREIVILKDSFDLFEGNGITEEILEILKPEVAVIYGVTTNVCVDFAAVGLARRVPFVYVVSDAIKELPNIPLPFGKWEKLGIKMITTEELLSSIA